jgi:hypothetical protein
MLAPSIGAAIYAAKIAGEPLSAAAIRNLSDRGRALLGW